MAFFSSEDKTSTEVTPIRKDQSYDWMDRYYGLLDKPMELYPEQMYAGMDPLQEEALGMREQYARGIGGMVDPALQAWQGTLNAPDVANNPYVQAMLEQQSNLLGRNFQENLLPGIQSGAIGAGQLGSSRQGVAEGLAARGTQEALASQAAATQMDAYGKGLAQQQWGLGAAPGMIGLGGAGADMLMGVGDIRRSEDEKAVQESMYRHDYAQQEPWNRMERFAQTYFPVTQPYAQTDVKSKTTPSALQMGGQLAGLGLAGAGMYQGFGLGGGGTPPVSSYGGTGYGMPNMSPVAYGGGLNDYLRPMRGY